MQPSKLKSFRSALTSISTIRYQRYHIRMVENKADTGRFKHRLFRRRCAYPDDLYLISKYCLVECGRGRGGGGRGALLELEGPSDRGMFQVK